eukprot:CAMPEP_0113703454 /NCGR_PEP_ID=MMETSP0038_2-20120614/25865_1 /TAXON_ID=2898 /ORGANISM="Cryptomonas paramecium" /LENGTH=49 /DNA_ID=CAMNT_0000627911 /DNA_START=233 /DNA_END=379 /DNA_ORIENTATION=+ /assembly_acc=CAM_ASM_000170
MQTPQTHENHSSNLHSLQGHQFKDCPSTDPLMAMKASQLQQSPRSLLDV